MFIGGPDVDLQLGLVRQLAQHVEISVLGSSPQACQAYAASGIQCETFPMVSGINPWRDALTVRSLAAHLRRIKPDLVHTHDTKISALGRIAAGLAGVPVIVGTLPGMGSLYSDDRLFTRVRRLPYEASQKIAAHFSRLTLVATADDRDDLVKRGLVLREKCLVVSTSGVDVGAFRPARLDAEQRARVRAQLGVDPGACVVTMVSRVIRSKGVLEYAAVARHWAALTPTVRFLLIGPHDDQSPDALGPQELASVRHSVQWLGLRSDVPDLLAVTDIAVLPTYYMEGIPRVILEAGATGLPVVATDTRGCRDVIEDGVSGLLVPPRSEAALEKAILDLVGDPAQRTRLGTALRDRVARDFDMATVAGGIAAVYDRLLRSSYGHR